MSPLQSFSYVCALIIGYELLKFMVRMLYNVLGPRLGLNVNFSEMGKWAVVTGASDGLGKAYSEALAERGLNIVLISRSQEKLKKVASDIESAYKVQTKIITADFTEGNEIYRNIEKHLTGLEIGVLINNVGTGYSYPEYFLEVKDNETFISNMIQCNVASVPSMCRIVMPGMVERGKGVIINVSSLASQVPNPLLSLYSATKSFVTKFSEDLMIEYGNKGIIIQCIQPGYVATKMSKIQKATLLAPTPQVYVESAMNTTGIESCSYGYFPHTVVAAIIHFVSCISKSLSEKLLKNMMLNIRSRAIRKLNK